MNEFHGGDQENQTIDAAMQDGNQSCITAFMNSLGPFKQGSAELHGPCLVAQESPRQ